MLLTEAIARTCKVILNNLLRKLVRRDKTSTIVASCRERSTYEDYEELMKANSRRKEDQVLDFFNLVLAEKLSPQASGEVCCPMLCSRTQSCYAYLYASTK